ncbi:type II toxin-antitoxin system RelB/DinJ family antitoxin [Limosilactobacillus albertensis]|uniref:Type II toxin-antitoxin system RelB/DinJ family antitoxin n=1 Tax=Limosilactobacillus albertensis TaxID=2759752 RepID=A0A839GWV4_9LACO|nr:type II toxin-antitoxin system RelB/DinJ family antitoxin [Limosilactobacillus albertensis]MBB1122593.1 type II toxin-antitoxin system RelB/DinJ family antitoxin [Limosilactobacillus albertensis]MCD7121385.1 type II toxin-antitoxin system RelB/DinJ family antitoxin [Limosilactobacillus albertensis]
MMNSVARKNKKVQVNVERNLANEAEDIMNEIGLNPTVVINALYKEIVATGRIPLSFSLTPEQQTALRIRLLSKDKPEKEINSEEEMKEFFDED